MLKNSLRQFWKIDFFVGQEFLLVQQNVSTTYTVPVTM